MRRLIKGPAGDGISGLNGRRVQDDREETPTLAIVEDAPVFSRETLSVRYSPHDWTTIWGAAALGQTRILAALLNRGEDVNRRDAEGKTPLIYATDFSQTSSLCLLLEWGADPNAADANGRTPLFFVRNSVAETLITILVNGGADPSIPNRDGHSPLFEARVQGNRRLASLLEKSGAHTGFLEAIAAGNLEQASGLPVNGNLNAPLPGGDTLLLRAVQAGDFSLAAMLLDRGADPNTPDASGRTPLEVAAARSRGRLMRLLLDAGANPDSRDPVEAKMMYDWAGIDS